MGETVDRINIVDALSGWAVTPDGLIVLQSIEISIFLSSFLM